MLIRLLYLMFARICAWLVLLGRSTASKDIELLVCFGIAGAWLASLTFGWLDPRRSRATAPTSTLDLHKPLPSAVQPQQSALNQRKRGEDRHRTAMVMALLIIATVLRRLFSNRRS